MYKKNENIVARKIHGSFFLIDITDNYAGDRCALYEINETGMFLWNNLISEKSPKELALLLQSKIIDDIDYQTIYSDVQDFLKYLISKRFISEVQYDG